MRFAGLNARMRPDWFRISRGPWRAPGRFVTPPSSGTPTSAMSASPGFSVCGARIRVGMPV